MTIPFQGAPGNLFNCLGKLGLIVKQVNSYQSAQKTNYIDPTNGAVVQLASEPDIQAVLGPAYLTDLSGPEVSCNTVANVAQLILNRKVWEDNPQPNQDLQTVNLSASIAELIRQMKLNNVTVLQMTVTATPGAIFNNTFATPGNPVIVTSVKRDYDGLVLENSFAESLPVTCSQDSFTGGATAYNESFTITGEANISDVFAWNWPLGSNASVSLSAINGEASNSSGNLLTNSGFDAFTVTNVPDGWTLTAGDAGSQLFEETSLIYAGTAALKILGDGSTLVNINQAVSVSAKTQYSCNLFLRCGGTTPTQGVLQIDLVDSNNNILVDDAGTVNSFMINLTTLNTNYQAFNGCFRLPYNIPAPVFLRLHLTTVLLNNVPIYLDKLSFGQMTQLYTSGPFVAIHSGNIPSVLGDYNTITVTNSRGAGGTLSTWQTLLNQFFSLQQSDILIPSSLTPTISDSLIG